MLESAVEQYNTATAKLAQTEKRIKTTQAQLDKAQKDLKTASERLGKRANGIYKDGQTGFWEAVFSAQSFSEFINRLNLLSRVGAQDGQILQQIQTFRTDVSAKKVQLDADRAEQTATRRPDRRGQGWRPGATERTGEDAQGQGASDRPVGAGGGRPAGAPPCRTRCGAGRDPREGRSSSGGSSRPRSARYRPRAWGARRPTWPCGT